MRQRQSELDRLNIRVAVVTFEPAARAASYARQRGVEWPILIDRSLELYGAYGMHHGRWWDLYGPSAWWIYAKLLARGRRMGMPRSDVRHLGGNVLIDPDGRVRLHHVGRGPADRPPVDKLIERVRRF